jgi:hypothetical protein
VSVAQPAGLRVRVGHETVAAGDAAALDAAIARSNAATRIAGLPDALNPSIIDAAKAHALLAALQALPAGALANLAGRSLYLNGPDLPVRATSPATPANFARLSGIEDFDAQGDTVLVRLALRPDCDLARAQATAARAAMAEAAAEVARLEDRQQAETASDRGGVLAELSVARSRRAAIAGAWHENAAAVARWTPRSLPPPPRPCRPAAAWSSVPHVT